MKNYTIIGGVNGVGKSSFTGVLKERSTDLGVIVDVDKITAELGGNALAGVRQLCGRSTSASTRVYPSRRKPPFQAGRRKPRQNR